MKKSKRSSVFTRLVITAFMLMSLQACSKAKPQDGDVALRINDHEILTEDFEAGYREIEGASKMSRGQYLDNLITRKLLLVEAQRTGLDQQKEFLRTVKNFWEQSLLKLVIEQKTKEIAAVTAPTEEEVRAAYERWVKDNPSSFMKKEEAERVLRWQVEKEKEAEYLTKWMEELRQKANIQINQAAVDAQTIKGGQA